MKTIFHIKELQCRDYLKRHRQIAIIKKKMKNGMRCRDIEITKLKFQEPFIDLEGMRLK